MEGFELLIDFLLIIGLVTNGLLILLLAFSKKDKFADHFLMGIYLIVVVNIVYFYGYLHDIRFLKIAGVLLGTGSGFLAGPLVFLYTKALIGNQKNFAKRARYHFLPFAILWVGLVFPLAISLIQREWLFEYLRVINENSDVISLLEGVSVLIYSTLSLQFLGKARSQLKAHLANLEHKDLEWLKRLHIGVLIVISLDIATSFYELSFGELSWNVGYLTAIALVLLMCYVGYYGIGQSRILVPEFLLEPSNSKQNEKVEAPRTPAHLASNSEEEISIITARLTELLQVQKVYKDESITLGTLASLLSISDKKLSELINTKLETTFYDLINRYRVEEVKEKMLSGKNDHLTLLGMAYESGFKSKTSFNRVFKQQVGMSPSEFRQQNS